MLKPGFQTTEFVVTVATLIGTLAAALAGDLSPRWAAVASAISAGAYALARGWAKSSGQPPATDAKPPPA